jgi:hypothetical protein
MPGTIIDLSHVDLVLQRFGPREFETPEFVDRFKVTFPEDWRTLVSKYGPGGARGGTFYSPNNYLGLQLMYRSRRGELRFITWAPAPEGWGNSKVARYKRS